VDKKKSRSRHSEKHSEVEVRMFIFEMLMFGGVLHGPYMKGWPYTRRWTPPEKIHNGLLGLDVQGGECLS
jgi:hypothetical protein